MTDTPNTPVSHPVLLFDGVCNLCNASVQWVLRRDRQGIFRFAALQSEAGSALLQRFGLSATQFDSVVLVDGDQVFTHSDAVLELLKRLGGVWKYTYIFKIFPRYLRDSIYNLVARNRYRVFGRTAACLLPRPEWKSRFL